MKASDLAPVVADLPKVRCPLTMAVRQNGSPRPREPRGPKVGTVHTIRSRSRYKPVLEPRGEVEPIYNPQEIEAAIAELRKEKELQAFLGMKI